MTMIQQEAILRELNAQRERRNTYPFLTLRRIRAVLDTRDADEIRNVIEPMVASGELVMGIIHNCDSYNEGMESCASRPHFIDFRKIIKGQVLECVGCGNIFESDDALRPFADPFKGVLAEVTVHLPQDTETLDQSRIRNFNVMEDWA